MKKHIVISGVAGIFLSMAGNVMAANLWISNGTNCSASPSPCGGNSSGAVQVGPNSSKTFQKGTNNQSYGVQVGSNNKSTARQKGGGNTAVTVQIGNGNTSTGSQSNAIVIVAPAP